MLSPFTTFITLMEQTKRPTISLVLPMIHKMILMLDPERTFVTHDDTKVEVSSINPTTCLLSSIPW